MKYTHDILIKKYAFLNMLYIRYVEVLVILMYGIIHLVCAKVFWKTNIYPLGTLAHVDDPYRVMVVTWYKFIIMPQWLMQAFFSSLSDYRILRRYRRLPDVNWGCYPALSNKRCWPESAAFVPSIQSPLKVSDNCCR